MRDPRNYESPLCAEVGVDTFYPEDIDGEGKNLTIRAAKRICDRCQHLTECAEWAIYNERFGIWGGLTSGQRIHIRRKMGIQVRREESA